MPVYAKICKSESGTICGLAASKSGRVLVGRRGCPVARADALELRDVAGDLGLLSSLNPTLCATNCVRLML